MASLIDPSVPVSGTTPGPTTASVRNNFAVAANEITSLQATVANGPFLPIAGNGTLSGSLRIGSPTAPSPPMATGDLNVAGRLLVNGLPVSGGTGGISSIVFSAPLTGGTITSSGTVGLGNVPVANLAGGVGASSSTFWRGDGTWAPAGGSGTPGGAAGNVQYNSAGTSFGGSTGATFNASSLTALNIALGGDAPGDMYFRNASGNLTRIAPGAAGNYLQSTGATAPTWVAIATGGGTVNNGTQGQLAIYPNAGSNAIVAGVTMSGDATINATGALTLNPGVNSTAGTYTNATITVNAKGLVTSAANGTGGGGGLPLTGGTITGTAPGNVIVQRAGTLPTAAAGAVATFWGVGNTSENAAGVIDAIAGVPGMILRRANGIPATPSAIIPGDVIGNIGFRGWFSGTGAGYAAIGNARILVTALEAFDATHQGTKLDIQTTAPGATTSVVQATFDRGLTIGVGTPVQAVPAPGDLNCMRLLINGSPPGGAAAVDVYATVTAAATPGAVLPTADFIEITAGSGGVQLPAGSAGLKRKIRNSLATTVSIYPLAGSGATINNGAANAPITLLANSTAYVESGGALKWFTIP